MKNKLAAELRSRYEARVKEAAERKNQRINQVKNDFMAEVKAIHKEIYN